MVRLVVLGWDMTSTYSKSCLNVYGQETTELYTFRELFTWRMQHEINEKKFFEKNSK